MLTSGLVPPARFAGNMERQQTDNLLKSHASGTYLIRERTAEAERFAISIKYVLAGGSETPLPQCRSESRAMSFVGGGGHGLHCPKQDTCEMKGCQWVYTA